MVNTKLNTDSLKTGEGAKLYSESMYAYFKRARVQNLLGQYGSSIFVVGLTWDMADQNVLLIYLIVHQILVTLAAISYYSKWTNSRLSPSGLPKYCLTTGILARLFCGSVFWMQFDACQRDVRFPLAVFVVLASLAIGTIVTIGPLKRLSRNTLVFLLAPGSLACLLSGHIVLGLAALYFLYVVAFKGVNKMHNSYCELIAMRYQSLLDSQKLQDKNSELLSANNALADEIHKREVVEREREEMQEELVEASREAGKAEIATGVLHNVGNVINSVNVSVELMHEDIRDKLQSRLSSAVDLLKSHEGDLAGFFANNPRGQHFMPFLWNLRDNATSLMEEFERLREHVDHVKSVVAAQQSYASINGLCSDFEVRDVLELAVEINRETIRHDRITLVREYGAVGTVYADKQKLIQILVNLLKNALHAIRDNPTSDRELRLEILPNDNQIEIRVIDTGCGISPQNLTKIFQHGFSTRKQTGGRGFGLHHSVCAIQEMGGRMEVDSEGINKGATFRLILPIKRTSLVIPSAETLLPSAQHAMSQARN